MIDTEEKLAAFLPKLCAADWVALDTEADSLHAYPEKVCLIQISIAGHDRMLDPLAGINIDPVLDALVGRELIMHGADYDLRLLRKHHEFTPSAIFDTMLAARLVGERQFGLSSLVEKYLGVKLDKASQKADWARRPLTEKMEAYARNDTHYLKPLVDKLKHELQQKAPARLASGMLCAAHRRLLAAARRGRRVRLAHQGQQPFDPPGAGRVARALALARTRSRRCQPPAVLHPEPRKTDGHRGCGDGESSR